MNYKLPSRKRHVLGLMPDMADALHGCKNELLRAMERQFSHQELERMQVLCVCARVRFLPRTPNPSRCR